jgi:hypothetical protein
MTGAPSRLPRSLDPLSGESLPGYVLRLAHRLDRSPARLLQLAGLHGHTMPHVRLGPVTHLDPDTAQRFARVTGLSVEEVAALCLSALTGQYAPLQPTYLGRRRDATRLATNEPWIFGRWSRYCQACLVGDGSPIQAHHGGAWQRTWRLPPVFACTAHQRLLAHQCPACRRPALHLPAGGGRLVPCDRTDGLHPAQCRNQLTSSTTGRVPCGHRLDQTGHDDPDRLNPQQLVVSQPIQLDEQLLQLQERILILLDPAGPDHAITFGQPTTASRYFTDLRLLANLVCATWPTASRLAPSSALAERLDAHVAERRVRIADMEQHNDKIARQTIYDQPPAETAATAALIAVADRILTGQSNVPGLLGALTDGPDGRRWATHFIRAEAHCSPGLVDAIASHVARYRSRRPSIPPSADRSRPARTGRSQPRRRRQTPGPSGPPIGILPLTPGAHRYQITNIPAFLPEPWYAAHFAQLPGLPERHLRRTVPLLLLQLTSPCLIADAAGLLGIPANSARQSYSVAASWFRESHDGTAFIDAVHTLADALDLPDHLVDYQRRRTVLAHWHIPTADWQTITAQVHRGRHTDLGDRKRNSASALVWTTVTSGEHLFAPHRASPPGFRPGSTEDRGLSIDRTWHRARHNKAGRHYPHLIQLLDELAPRVAQQIDHARIPHAPCHATTAAPVRPPAIDGG